MSDNVLTKVSGIGVARAVLLNQKGIQTLEDLAEISLEDLAAVKTIGKVNAQKIKAAVERMIDKTEASPLPLQNEEDKVDFEDEKTILDEMVQLIDPKSFKLLARARASLEDVQTSVEEGLEAFKPLGKKQWLKHYIDYKTKAKKLNKRIKAVKERLEDMSKKEKKAIAKAAVHFERSLRELFAEMKKKRFKKVNREMEEFRIILKSFIED
ncbi:MAG: hypothetical protein CSA81_09815 [Acidobacteria bacterium]|nr:MAG: hypothetical protein CSA81_09815 [Acidobacteriota bacterium]